MRGKTDRNDVVIFGKVTKAKAWDPKPGKAFSNGSVTVRAGDVDLPVTVFLSITQKADDRVAFNKTFQTGANVCLTKAQMSSYTKKAKSDEEKDTEVFQIEAKLNGSYQVGVEGHLVAAIISGTIKGAKGNKAVLESAYFAGGPDGRTGEIKSRKIRIISGSNLEDRVGKHVTVIGSSIEVNDSGPLVKADCVAEALE